MSGRPSVVAVLRHVLGLAFALVLGLVCLVAIVATPLLIDGTPARDLGTLAAFAAVVAVLGAGDRLWTLIERIAAGRSSGGG